MQRIAEDTGVLLRVTGGDRDLFARGTSEAIANKPLGSGMADDSIQKFQTFLLFLRHFYDLVLAERDDSSEEKLILALLREQAALLRTPAPRSLSPDLCLTVRKRLFNAWNSETVARMNSNFDVEVRVITNQWKPVQAYYALYFLLAAVHEIHQPGRRHAHETTLRFATSTIGQKLPKPWCCQYDFDNGQCVAFPWANLPHVMPGWNISRYTPAEDFVANLLRTTGEEKQRERWREHYKGKHKRNPAGHARAGKLVRTSDMQVGVISFWDVLWRLRKWVNYKEAEAMLEGQDLEGAHEFDAALNSILTTSATVLENLLNSLLGSARMNEMYDCFLTTVGGKVDLSHLKLRRDLICGVPF